MGHYVLNHIRNSLLLLALALLALFWAGSHIVRRLVPDVSDWTSLPVMLLMVVIVIAISEPVVNTYSRWQEHQADIYGLEVTHGVVPDSSAVAAHSFQVMGEIGLDEPNPNRFIEFCLFTHPSISDRVAFAQSYDPWASGHPKYVNSAP